MGHSSQMRDCMTAFLRSLSDCETGFHRLLGQTSHAKKKTGAIECVCDQTTVTEESTLMLTTANSTAVARAASPSGDSARPRAPNRFDLCVCVLFGEHGKTTTTSCGFHYARSIACNGAIPKLLTLETAPKPSTELRFADASDNGWLF